jgi:chloramphenicol-sensitive protein RarD
MSPRSPNETTLKSISGAICGASAFLIWGISPLYWKLLMAVPALEIAAHRVVWSFLIVIPFILTTRRRKELLLALTNPRSMTLLVVTSLLVGCNWLVYIWAINNGHLLQASLGYYINPLVNVLLGTLFLKERLRVFQVFAVILAGTGVLYLTIVYGQFPWIACILALTFGFYGLIRKTINVGSLVGLAMETFLLTVPALGYLIFVDLHGAGAFGNGPLRIDLLLAGTSVITATPLLLFAMSARRVKLTTLGFLQYIGPSGMFLMAIFIFLEPFRPEQLVSFVLIWAALVLYSIDSVIHFRKTH